MVQEIDHLLENHTLKEIAAILNERGFTTVKEKAFTRIIVSFIIKEYRLKDRYTRLREAVLLTADKLARL